MLESDGTKAEFGLVEITGKEVFMLAVHHRHQPQLCRAFNRTLHGLNFQPQQEEA